MVGFPEEMNEFPRKDLRSFGEDMKQFSDVTLKVKERKFYISKLYLSSHSPYFATLFLGRFQESEKSEIELKDVNPQDFQYYLEVLHLENGIDDDTVQGILSVAYLFDTPIIVKKCEKFLLEKSKKGLKEKLEMAGNYRMEGLKKHCLDEIKSKADIRSVIPADPMEMDPKNLAELFKKALVFN
ncbi:Protein CBG10283 [Caenorhabditis briggsae]|uniref:Protein CBG10283 n=2 Tax=Caenorhabditis briggsae TaxID=6238 RepID=A8XAP6_CAEBR|nr:Protein CBG10283 [Caenorhabditis briggsae]CAP29711.1 Protein CBG10283 [Caenorhabditis briggsae]